MANHNLGTIRGTIEIDYDGAGIVRAVKDSDKAKKSLGDLDGASSKVLNAFGKFASGAVKTAGAIGLVSNSLSLVAGLVSTVGPLLAAGFAAAPAIILSFASALIIAKVAIAGVGDALGAAFETEEKFQKALEKLSPQAQKFAKAFRAAVPQITAVKNAIQDAFFKGSAEAVGGVVNRVASLRPQAQGVAFALGQIAQNIVKTATNSGNIEKLRLILAGVNAFLLQIKRSIGPVVTGFIGLAAQASKFGGVVGGQLADALASFSIFLNNVDLAAVFQTALPIIKSLAGFFADLARIAKQLFSIFIGDGGGAVGVLGELASKLADFLESAQGQAALDALGQAMQAISGSAGQIFLALLQALAPALVALAPGITLLANQIAGVLVPAINFLNPLLTQLAGFLSENMSWLGPVAGAVVALAAAYKVYAAAAKAVAAVQTILASKIVKSTAAWIANTAATVANKVVQLASAAATGGAAVAAWIANTAAVIANRVAVSAAAIAMGVIRAATIAWTAVQWALNTALFANPIGLIVLAIIALVGVIILAWKNSETFRNVVMAVWGAIKTAISAVVDWFVGTAWPFIKQVIDFIINYYKLLWNITKAIWTGIFNAIRTALTWIKNIVTTVWNAIVSGIKAYINAYKAVIMAGMNFIRNAWNNFLKGLQIIARAVWSAITSFIQSRINAIKNVIRGVQVVVSIVRNAFNNAKNAAVNAIASLLSTVRGIPGRIRSALGGLARLLYSKGQELIRGFINGIGSMIGAVRDKVSSVVGAVTRFLPGSPAKEGPLSGKGYVLLRARRFMNDFARGLEDGSQKPTAALMGAVNPVARAVVPTSSTTKSGASTASTPAVAGTGGTREYNIGIGDKMFAKLVVDALSGEPVAVKKIVDKGKQQFAWAGGR